MSQPPSMPPEQRLPLLHKMIDDLPAEELEIVEHVLARLEMDRLWKEVREGFDADWESGKYEKLDEVIGEARLSITRCIAGGIFRLFRHSRREHENQSP